MQASTDQVSDTKYECEDYVNVTYVMQLCNKQREMFKMYIFQNKILKCIMGWARTIAGSLEILADLVLLLHTHTHVPVDRASRCSCHLILITAQKASLLSVVCLLWHHEAVCEEQVCVTVWTL